MKREIKNKTDMSLIRQYLKDRMSANERKLFEDRINVDKDLRGEVDLYRMLIEQLSDIQK